jgi:hypothetical protein
MLQDVLANKLLGFCSSCCCCLKIRMQRWACAAAPHALDCADSVQQLFMALSMQMQLQDELVMLGLNGLNVTLATRVLSLVLPISNFLDDN